MLHRLLGRAADDEGRAGFVNEDVVHLVHYGEVAAPALHLQVGFQGHIVAQVVKAEFVVGAVENVGAVGIGAGHRDEAGVAALAGVGQLGVVAVGGIVLEAADGEAEEVIDRAHPDGVAAGEVVVDGDDVDGVAGEGVEVGGQCSDQGFAFAGFHFGDFALVQDGAADELDIVMALAEGAAGGFADDGEGFGQQVVGGGAIVQAAAELVGFGAQGGVVQGAYGVLQPVNLGDELFGDFGGGAFRRVADHFFDEGNHRKNHPAPARRVGYGAKRRRGRYAYSIAKAAGVTPGRGAADWRRFDAARLLLCRPLDARRHSETPGG